MNKKKARKIVIAMWVLAVICVLAGAVISHFGMYTHVLLTLGAIGVSLAYISEVIIDHYDL